MSEETIVDISTNAALKQQVKEIKREELIQNDNETNRL